MNTYSSDEILDVASPELKAQTEFAVELIDVNLAFGPDVVLDKVNLQIRHQEKWAIIGPSGQGKSVLLKCMAGLIVPNSGEVRIDGNNWQDSAFTKKDRKTLLRRLGMLFQKNALFDSLTCGNNVAFALQENGGASSAEIDKKVDLYLDAVGIPHAKNLFPEEISGGMQKRLGIARALALQPEIIFYDDPTAGLDPITSRKIIDLICGLQAKSKSTFVAITNDMNRAYQMADKILMVVDRAVIFAGTPKTIKDNTDPRVHQFIRGLMEGPLTVLGEAHSG